MSNTLTNLIPDLYNAADTISRELTGFIPSVYLNSTADQAAVNQSIVYPVVGANTAGDIAAAATGPDPADRVTGNSSMSITKARSVTFYRTGEETMGLGSLGKTLLQLEFEQAMRTLVNEVEADLAALHLGASRAYAAHATTPAALFASNLGEVAQVRKILADNGAPTSDMQLVMNTTAGAALRTLANLSSTNAAGIPGMINQGVLIDIHGMKLRESAQVKSVSTVGTNTGPYVANGAHAAGATTITLKTGTGTILAGDIITFGTNTADKYVVVTGCAAAGDIVIAAPGLRSAISDGAAVAVVGACARNMAFDRNAIHLLTRVPAMPEGGDAADDVMNLTDPQSGITFQVAMYRQRRRIAYEVGLAWGVKAVKTAHIGLLLGQ
jgi:hypothetical protein